MELSLYGALIAASLGLGAGLGAPALTAEAPRAFNDCNDRPLCPAMVALPAGRFMMGSPDDEPGRYADEGPRRSVVVAAFAVSASEITFDQWAACVADGGCAGNPAPDDNGWGRGSRPVINVSWTDAQAYVDWLGRKTGHVYRLPSEAEWEYAARGGSDGPFSWGWTPPSCAADAAAGANFHGCGHGRSLPVGSFPASTNGFGLQDVQGNVWEWVRDCYSADGLTPEPAICPLRSMRGGSWDVEPKDLRLANRFKMAPGFRSPHLGFRVARDLP